MAWPSGWPTLSGVPVVSPRSEISLLHGRAAVSLWGGLAVTLRALSAACSPQGWLLNQTAPGRGQGLDGLSSSVAMSQMWHLNLN